MVAGLLDSGWITQAEGWSALAALLLLGLSYPLTRLGLLAAAAWAGLGMLTLLWPNKEIGFSEWAFTQEFGIATLVVALLLLASAVRRVRRIDRWLRPAGAWLVAAPLLLVMGLAPVSLQGLAAFSLLSMAMISGTMSRGTVAAARGSPATIIAPANSIGAPINDHCKMLVSNGRFAAPSLPGNTSGRSMAPVASTTHDASKSPWFVTTRKRSDFSTDAIRWFVRTSTPTAAHSADSIATICRAEPSQKS